LEASDKVIAKLEQVKVEGINYRSDEWIETLPFMEQQMEQDREDLIFAPDDGERELYDMDIKPFKAAVIAGQRPVLFPNLDTKNLRFGDFDYEEEERLKKEGRWSIARTFASKEERQKITERVDKLLAGN